MSVEDKLYPHDILAAGKNSGAVIQDVVETARRTEDREDVVVATMDMVRTASYGVLQRLRERGVADAVTLSRRLEDLSEEDQLADLFKVSAAYEQRATDTTDAAYQRQQLKLAALARTAAATSAATAVYAMQGPEYARPTTSIARSMVEEAYYGMDISVPAHEALSTMVAEIEHPSRQN